MTTASTAGGKLRAYLEFVLAIVFFFAARSLARHVAQLAFNGPAEPLIEQACLAGLLIFTYALFGVLFDRQKSPVGAQGLPLRTGWAGEAGMGVAVGWGAAVVCALLLTLVGGIAVVLSTQAQAWIWLGLDAVFFVFVALAEEVAFRGYGYQRFASVVGPVGASIGFAAYYGLVQALLPGSSRLSFAVAFVLGLVLSAAYVRTKALWVSWGLNFGWKASRALIFGLTVSGVSSHSSVVEGDPMGPFWLTGGGYGLDASWLAFFLMLLLIPVVFRLTRELDFKYNVPVIIPGGHPVDLDAAARRQHDAAMGPAAPPAAPGLVQILPVAAPIASKIAETPETGTPDSHSPA